jgi:hypothetical protein
VDERRNKLATGSFNQFQFLNCQPGASPGSLSLPLPIPDRIQPNFVTSVDGYDLATLVCFPALGAQLR